MNFIYPAVIRKKANGSYHAFFPDLTCCEADGDSVDDVIDRANEAAATWIMAEFEEEEPEFPPVSDMHDIVFQEGDLVRNSSVNYRFRDGWDE